MRDMSRRGLIAAAAGTALAASPAGAQAPSPSGPVPERGPKGADILGPKNPQRAAEEPNTVAPPATDHGTMPNLKWSFADSHMRLEVGGWARQTTIRELPISKAMAGVNMRLKANAVREMHWHKEAEWSYMIKGRARITAVDQDGRTFADDVGPGDLWYFPKGHGHSIQTIGDKPCHFILSFDNGAFSEHGTFSITDWIDVTPKDMLALDFGLPADVFDKFPKGEAYIQAGPVVPVSQALDAPWPKESTHKFRLLKDPRAVREFDGGTFRLATVDEWPIQKTMSGGVMTIRPGQMRKLHWNVNANEWHFYLKVKGQVAVFGSGGRGKVAEFKPGDVAYIPMGFGHAIKNIGDEDLEIIQTWDNGKFEEIDLDAWVKASPNYLLSNNFPGVSPETIAKMKQA